MNETPTYPEQDYLIAELHDKLSILNQVFDNLCMQLGTHLPSTGAAGMMGQVRQRWDEVTEQRRLRILMGMGTLTQSRLRMEAEGVRQRLAELLIPSYWAWTGELHKEWRVQECRLDQYMMQPSRSYHGQSTLQLLPSPKRLTVHIANHSVNRNALGGGFDTIVVSGALRLQLPLEETAACSRKLLLYFQPGESVKAQLNLHLKLENLHYDLSAHSTALLHPTGPAEQLTWIHPEEFQRLIDRFYFETEFNEKRPIEVASIKAVEELVSVRFEIPAQYLFAGKLSYSNQMSTHVDQWELRFYWQADRASLSVSVADNTYYRRNSVWAWDEIEAATQHLLLNYAKELLANKVPKQEFTWVPEGYDESTDQPPVIVAYNDAISTTTAE